MSKGMHETIMEHHIREAMNSGVPCTRELLNALSFALEIAHEYDEVNNQSAIRAIDFKSSYLDPADWPDPCGPGAEDGDE